MPNEIITGLWLCDNNDILNKRFIVNKNINCIISNLNIKKKYNNIEFIYFPVKINKIDLNNIIENKKINNLFYDYINDIIKYISKNLKNYKNIMIYSKEGQNIATTIIAAYILTYTDLKPIDVLKSIQNKTNIKILDNNYHFFSVLEKIYNNI